MMTFDEAVAHLTAVGAPFETGRVEVGGVSLTAFVHAPPTLRELMSVPEHRSEKVYLVFEDERWTFGDVERRSNAMAAHMVTRLGVNKGDRVMIAMRNYPEWICAFKAITSIGAIAVLANAWWTSSELEYALDDSEPSLVIADRQRLDRMADWLTRSRRPALVVRDEGPPSGLAVAVELLEAAGEPPEVTPLFPDDDATIVYTSGTTGSPKGAISTHRAVTQAVWGFGCRAAVDRLRRPVDLAPAGSEAVKPCFILCVPLFHVTGCIGIMLPTFSRGVRVVMMYKWDPSRALELIERESVTNFVGVPTMAWDLMESPDFARRDTSSLRSIGGGGAPAPPELVKRVRAKLAATQPSIGYGMTETNSYGPQNTGDDYTSRPTSAGRATPILELGIMDDSGALVPAGTRGEIVFRGPNVFRGYWKNEAATAATLVNGWLRSGDIGRIDDEGFVYVEDRAKDMIIRGGENVYCAEVEAAAYEHPLVAEAAAFGVPHDRLGEEVAMVVRTKVADALDVEELARFLGGRLAAFKVPSRIVVTDQAMPRNAAGKLLKTDLRMRVVDTSLP